MVSQKVNRIEDKAQALSIEMEFDKFKGKRQRDGHAAVFRSISDLFFFIYQKSTFESRLKHDRECSHL